MSVSTTLACTKLQAPGPSFVHITEASIVFNETISMGTSNINCALDYGKDVQTIALHELGHFAGLDESNDSAAAMYPSYNGCQRTTDGHDVSSMNEQYDDHQ